ncbi:hypothetical protein LFT45_13635 [Arthrobacter sp. FW305-BF8]|nr:hypothetical protein [Arthrobacter sp. FW305-BF8]UKA52788.1 hypothetical protein LFT45_13635 [Arthrobacter sp. FW305-BF8]
MTRTFLFDDGPYSDAAAVASTTASGWVLPAADLTADGPGLINQIRG